MRSGPGRGRLVGAADPLPPGHLGVGMPKTTKRGGVRTQELPSTLQRSDAKAQRTFAKTLDSAEATYHDEQAAHRVAYAAVKHTHEKVGDHWEPKDHKGPSDEQAAGGVDTQRATKGGVDANATKSHLLSIARRLDVRGRSRMSKSQLVDAIQHANDRETAKRRSR